MSKLTPLEAKLLAALKQCADELAAEIEGRYGKITHPHQLLKYNNDMTTVTDARSAIKQARGK